MQQITQPAIVVEHLAHMAAIIAFVQKVEERHLLQHGDVNIDKAPHGQQRLHQFGRRDQVAQAQGGKEHFAKGADIEYSPGMVQPLQRL